MDKIDLQLESLKMTKEWSAWLVAIQTAICGFLWNAVKANPMILNYDPRGFSFSPEWQLSLAGVSLHLAWLLFALSLLTAAFLLLRLPSVIEALKKDEDTGESVLAMKTPLVGIRASLSLGQLVYAEYLFFLAGALLTAAFVLMT